MRAVTQHLLLAHDLLELLELGLLLWVVDLTCVREVILMIGRERSQSGSS